MLQGDLSPVAHSVRRLPRNGIVTTCHIKSHFIQPEGSPSTVYSSLNHDLNATFFKNSESIRHTFLSQSSSQCVRMATKSVDIES